MLSKGALHAVNVVIAGARPATMRITSRTIKPILFSTRNITYTRVTMDKTGKELSSKPDEVFGKPLTEISADDMKFTDEEVDEWLQTLEELKSEFSEREFLPEVSLAPPGQARIDIVAETKNSLNEFEPTKEQIEEWEALKDKPLPQLKDPVIQHVTNMIMRHGKKDRAEKIISRALYFLFCKTRKDPVELLKKALDDMAPLMIVKTFSTGVAKAAVIPVPLNKRQRNRIAWKWIVEGANKRISSDFAVRLGEELVAVYEGRSSGFEKRDQMHKTAIAHRSYIKLR